MHRRWVWAGLAVVIFAACSSSGSKASTSTSTSAGSPATAVTTTALTASDPSTSTTSAAVVTTTTTTAGCPQSTGSTSPVSTPKSQGSSLLTTVNVASATCTDKVIFGFIAKGGGKPGCSVAYKSGPFVQDASGKPVPIAGAAFVVVRCAPAYGYDFETGRTTYTGPKRITASGGRYVRELAETGDFEGVVSWVVGLTQKRPFNIAATTVPPGISTLTITFS